MLILSYLRNNGEIRTKDFAARLRSWCEQGLRCLDRIPLGLGRTVGSVCIKLGNLLRVNADAVYLFELILMEVVDCPQPRISGLTRGDSLQLLGQDQ